MSSNQTSNLFPTNLDLTKLLSFPSSYGTTKLSDPIELILRHQLATIPTCFNTFPNMANTVTNSVHSNDESFSISKLIDSEIETNPSQDLPTNLSLADSASSRLMTELLRTINQTNGSPEFSFNSNSSSPVQRLDDSTTSVIPQNSFDNKSVFPDIETSSNSSINILNNPPNASVQLNDNESNTSSVDSNGNKIDVNWLRNLIRTAGAVIKPGKPTSFFQLRQRRDSAEITSLAKDLESRKKRFVCTFPNCTKAYYKRSHLKEHSYIHTGDKPYVCSHSDCGARFTRADQLSRHRRAHTGERNFCCLVCSKRFKRSDHLKVHLARHAGQQFDNSFLPTLNSTITNCDSSKENSTD